ncbi:MAG: IS4 family transposase [bacterium]|nr:IS4 family transposase [bacterium]
MIPNASEWAAQQWAQADLGDKRRTRVAVHLGAKMAANPEASLPNQMEDPAALKAAYRLLNNPHPKVSLKTLLTPHCQQTLAAARQVPLVLMVEDTTELDYTAHPSKTGLGPIGNGKGRGLLLHSTLAIEPQTRTVLGLAHAQVVLRQATPKPPPKWTQSPEGRVWAVSAQAVGRPPEGVTWIHVSDRGSDIFEYMVTCLAQGKHFLIRAGRNRRLTWETEAPEGEQSEAQALLDYARSLLPHPASAHTVEVPARDGQSARQACLALQWVQVTIPPPVQAPPEVRQHPPITVWLVRVWEPDPPAGVEPLEWILLCSWPITTASEAQRVVDWYTCRWFCEDYHQCVKSGCRVERSQLDDGADIQRLLGFTAPIAVRLLQLRQAARQTPQVPATTLVDPLMVQMLAQRQKKQEWERMTVEEFWRGVARLGGHQGRRRDGPPGWRTVWRGWRKLSDLTEGARLFAAWDTS